MVAYEQWQSAFDSRAPIYRQIVSRFTVAVARGDLAPGDRILSIRDMSVALKVNANTVQRAYQEMERARLIYSQRGTGYYVMPDDGLAERVRDNMVAETLRQFLDEMRGFGLDDEQIVSALRLQMRQPPQAQPQLAARDKLGEGGDGNAAAEN